MIRRMTNGMTMLKLFSILGINFLLFGCMQSQNPEHTHISQMRYAKKPIAIHTQFFPITPALVAKQHQKTYQYLVSQHDVLSVRVWQHPEFDFQKGSVDSLGEILLPLLGKVQVSGKPVAAIQADITTRLKQFVPNPQVLVNIASYQGQKISLLGDIAKPGQLTITDQPLTLAQALIQSGTLNYNTENPRFIYIIRGDTTHHTVYWMDATALEQLPLANQFYLRSNDLVYVSATTWSNFKYTLFNA